MAKRITFSFEAKKVGSQRRDRSRIGRASLLSFIHHLDDTGLFNMNLGAHQEKVENTHRKEAMVPGSARPFGAEMLASAKG
jgi:hypothetical protein